MNILCFANTSPERWWRLDMPKKWLERNTDWKITITDLHHWFDYIDWCDVVIGRSFISERAVQFIHSIGKKIFYEIDGAEPLLSDKYFKALNLVHKKKIHIALQKTIESCDGVLVSTEPLAKWVRNFITKPVILFPNYMDFEWWEKDGADLITKTDQLVRLGWFGMPSHRFDIQNILVPIMQALDTSRQYQFCLPQSVIHVIPKKLHRNIIPIQSWSIDDRPALAKKLGIQIMLIPLEHNKFNACKSAIKYFENAADHIAGIYSSTVYKEYITHRNTGMIANTVSDWIRSIGELAQNEKLRKTLVKNAYTDVYQNYNARTKYAVWKEAICSLI